MFTWTNVSQIQYLNIDIELLDRPLKFDIKERLCQLLGYQVSTTSRNHQAPEEQSPWIQKTIWRTPERGFESRLISSGPITGCCSHLSRISLFIQGDQSQGNNLDFLSHWPGTRPDPVSVQWVYSLYLLAIVILIGQTLQALTFYCNQVESGFIQHLCHELQHIS